MFPIFKHVMKSERGANSEPGLPVIKACPSFAQQINYSIDHIIKRFHEENSIMPGLFR